MTFEETSKAMLSEDYRERFRAEYWQLSIRTDRLYKILENYNKNGILGFDPKCSFALLQDQLIVMQAYLEILEKRAKAEGIEL